MIFRLVLLIALSLVVLSCAAPRIDVRAGTPTISIGGASNKSSKSKPSKESQYITVFGSGADLESAKVSAMRAALSIAEPQLMISELTSIDGKIETNLLQSTMFGYLSYFKILEQALDENEFIIIKANIGISENKVKNKMYSQASRGTLHGGSRFDGSRIAREVLEAKALKEAKELQARQQLSMAKALSKNLFAHYPSKAVVAKIDSVGLDPENPGIINLEFSYKFREHWRKEFWLQVKVIHELLQDYPKGKEPDVIDVCSTTFQGKKGKCHYSLPSSPVPGVGRGQRHSVVYVTDGYNPASDLADRRLSLLIPVISSTGEFITCLQETVSNMVWHDNIRRHYKHFDQDLLVYGTNFYPAPPRISRMQVKSDLLYSSGLKAEYFYPYLTHYSNKEPEKREACKTEGRLRHLAASKTS